MKDILQKGLQIGSEVAFEIDDSTRKYCNDCGEGNQRTAIVWAVGTDRTNQTPETIKVLVFARRNPVTTKLVDTTIRTESVSNLSAGLGCSDENLHSLATLVARISFGGELNNEAIEAYLEQMKKERDAINSLRKL